MYTNHKSLKYLPSQRELNLSQHRWMELVQTLRELNDHLSLSDDGEIVVELIAKLNFLNQVLVAQNNDEKISTIVNRSRERKETKFTVKEDGFLYF